MGMPPTASTTSLKLSKLISTKWLISMSKFWRRVLIRFCSPPSGRL
jgi:hypothetical protein